MVGLGGAAAGFVAFGVDVDRWALHQVPGVVPSPREFVQGDRFAPRSSHPTVGLDVRPEMVAVSDTGHRYAAHPDSAYTEEAQR